MANILFKRLSAGGASSVVDKPTFSAASTELMLAVETHNTNASLLFNQAQCAFFTATFVSFEVMETFNCFKAFSRRIHVPFYIISDFLINFLVFFLQFCNASYIRDYAPLHQQHKLKLVFIPTTRFVSRHENPCFDFLSVTEDRFLLRTCSFKGIFYLFWWKFFEISSYSSQPNFRPNKWSFILSWIFCCSLSCSCSA